MSWSKCPIPADIIALLLDMDGVLYHGEAVISDAHLFMQAISHLPHMFITNNPILPPEYIADRLQLLGFQRPQSQQIITSAEATALWLSQQKPNFRYFAVGADGLDQALRRYGTADSYQADYVVVGEGEGISFDAITTGINLISKQGAQLISTNPDHSVDASREGKHTILPGGGALVAPFAIAANAKPITIGKPNPLLYKMALQRLGVEAANSLMVGDRPDTDIAGAAALGMRTALVRTGRFAVGERIAENLPKPDWDVANLSELLLQWRLSKQLQ